MKKLIFLCTLILATFVLPMSSSAKTDPTRLLGTWESVDKTDYATYYMCIQFGMPQFKEGFLIIDNNGSAVVKTNKQGVWSSNGKTVEFIYSGGNKAVWRIKSISRDTLILQNDDEELTYRLVNNSQIDKYFK